MIDQLAYGLTVTTKIFHACLGFYYYYIYCENAWLWLVDLIALWLWLKIFLHAIAFSHRYCRQHNTHTHTHYISSIFINIDKTCGRTTHIHTFNISSNCESSHTIHLRRYLRSIEAIQWSQGHRRRLGDRFAYFMYCWTGKNRLGREKLGYDEARWTSSKDRFFF